jgi:hypothetical protein
MSTQKLSFGINNAEKMLQTSLHIFKLPSSLPYCTIIGILGKKLKISSTIGFMTTRISLANPFYLHVIVE